MVYVTFEKIPSARTGNLLFQYLFVKRLSIQFGHTYIPIEEVTHQDNVLRITDDTAKSYLFEKCLHTTMKNKNIICRGFFQQDIYFNDYRQRLLEEIYHCEDYFIGCGGEKEYIKTFLTGSQKQKFRDTDVVLSLRLDDFIQLPCPTSDILPPSFYLDILESIYFDTLYIVCDKLHHDWEHKYMRFFDKWSPVLLQNDLLEDCGVMLDCPQFIHSNSTLCWFMSFCSQKKKERFIPQTHFYGGQKLGVIERGDRIYNVNPLKHQEVYDLDVVSYYNPNIHPLSYCIPDELIVDYDVLKKKTTEVASLVPGETSTYIFGVGEEDKYYEMYQTSLFAHTRKKGGWDCLRHYEIMANGCIPIFEELEHCPSSIMTTFPKELVQEACRELLPWNYNNKPLYDSYVMRILSHISKNCSASAQATYFLQKMSGIKQPKNVLMIQCNHGINYSRELFWIGLNRFIRSQGGTVMEYPKMDYLYDSYTKDCGSLYGNGFTYSKRLEGVDEQYIYKEVIQKIESRFFDLIIFGKVGPDELNEGSIPDLPLWNYVFKKYGKHEIAFIYGGDETTHMNSSNKYRDHLYKHVQYGTCFVRELCV